MPRKDDFHETVRTSLEKEQWYITNDPLFIPTQGGTNFFIDLGAERFIGAEKDGENIAVEIKSFGGNNPMYKFYELLGQFLVYKLGLEEQVKYWDLFIAISDVGYNKLDDSPIFKKAIQKYQLQFVIIDPILKSIIEWKK